MPGQVAAKSREKNVLPHISYSTFTEPWGALTHSP